MLERASRVDIVVGRVRSAIAALGGVNRFWVAVSGGGDSNALLHVMVQLDAEFGRKRLGAVHVNHGLSPSACRWQQTVEELCAALDVELVVRRISVPARGGHGLEAEARRRRYHALASVMEPGDVLLTAHHRDDQVETVLLNLFRGSGSLGLGGMRAERRFPPGRLCRPLLAVSREEIVGFLALHGLTWVEDHSNLDRRHRRNFLRHEVLPMVQEQWPGVRRTIERTACLQREASLVLEEVAAADLAAAGGERPGTIRAGAIRALGPQRARNALRYWLGRRGLPMPSEASLRAIMRCVIDSRPQSAPLARWPGGMVRRYRSSLFALRPAEPLQPFGVVTWATDRALLLPHGTLSLVESAGGRLDVARLRSAVVEVRLRRGGDRCRPCGRGLSKALKQVFQEHGVPPWERERLPLVLVDGQIAAIPGYVICEPFTAALGGPGGELVWSDNAAG